MHSPQRITLFLALGKYLAVDFYALKEKVNLFLR